jgi:hypothetical protein
MTQMSQIKAWSAMTLRADLVVTCREMVGTISA